MEYIKDNYLEIQMHIILSNPERYKMWEEYKLYVDELVFNGLLDATKCR